MKKTNNEFEEYGFIPTSPIPEKRFKYKVLDEMLEKFPKLKASGFDWTLREIPESVFEGFAQTRNVHSKIAIKTADMLIRNLYIPGSTYLYAERFESTIKALTDPSIYSGRMMCNLLYKYNFPDVAISYRTVSHSTLRKGQAKDICLDMDAHLTISFKLKPVLGKYFIGDIHKWSYMRQQ